MNTLTLLRKKQAYLQSLYDEAKEDYRTCYDIDSYFALQNSLEELDAAIDKVNDDIFEIEYGTYAVEGM